MKLLIVTGMSGSGKTIALRALEDAGFFCTDNLPIFLLDDYLKYMAASQNKSVTQIAVGIDVRSQLSNMTDLPAMIKRLQTQGFDCEVISIEAKRETLIKRFSETRRKHPLSDQLLSLEQAIDTERELLAPLIESADLRIDTTQTTLHELRELIRKRVSSKEDSQLSILFESFGFKHGVPADADFVFDVRCLPNPHWQPELRPLTGLNDKVVEFLAPHQQSKKMLKDLTRFLEDWIPNFEADGRSYLTVAIGCTGGQHRSVYISNQLYQHFSADRSKVLSRHRELS
ncbi:MAG: RNase adapter RapZ [Candidatus Polarisedimenticolaceae bacterium]|nr:RNase adapter RapZ [Candidatus Polarisedimenticolaceae bacterium]